MGNFNYYKVEFKLIREMLATLSETSIMQEHVLRVAMKQIKKANKEGARITKNLQKYYGTEISDEKVIEEIKKTIATFSELTGEMPDISSNEEEELLQIAIDLEKKYHEMIKGGNLQKATVFMRMIKPDTPNKYWPIISTHMVTGNLKAICHVITNNSTLKKEDMVFKSKVSVNEALSLDIKPIEYFMIPSNDIRRWGDGSPNMVDMPEGATNAKEPNSDRMLLERPITFNKMGKTTSSIALSERLPINTTFGCTLRVRADSILTEQVLNDLFDYGKNLGLGQWRGSGNMGAYRYKLTHLPNYKEPTDPDGFK